MEETVNAVFGDNSKYVDLSSTIICILGVVSNVLLLVAFIKDPLKCFRNSGTYLVMNLSVSDCLMSLFSSVLSVLQTTSPLILNLLTHWIAGVSFVSIASISIDRFLMVSSPIKHRTLMKGKVMILWISTIWIVNFVFPASLLFTDIAAINASRVIASFCAIVIVLSAVMYSCTYSKLKKQSRNMTLQNSTESRAQEIRILKEKRFLNTIIIIASIAFVSTVPFLVFYSLIYFMIFLVKNSQTFMLFYIICSFVFFINFAANPLIYILRLPNYRRTFYLLYCTRRTSS